MQCAWCLHDKELCESHSIPDSLFKLISRKNNGQLIAIPSGLGKIHQTQDSGKIKILCKECESIFNKTYDAPFTNCMKEWDKLIVSSGLTSRYVGNPNQMAAAVISICWRACIARLKGSKVYSAAKLNKSDFTKLDQLIRMDRSQVLRNCYVKISRLYDQTYDGHTGISQVDISALITPVQTYEGKARGKQKITHIMFDFVVTGFLIQLLIPRPSGNETFRPGVLRRKQTKLFAPPIHFLDYKPIKEILMDGYDKHIHGQTTIKLPTDKHTAT